MINKDKEILKLIVKDNYQKLSNKFKINELYIIKINAKSINSNLSNKKDNNFFNSNLHNYTKITNFIGKKSIKYSENIANNKLEDSQHKLTSKDIYNKSIETKFNLNTSKKIDEFKIPFKIKYKSKENLYIIKHINKRFNLNEKSSNLSQNSSFTIKKTFNYEYVSKNINNEIFF